ncbi:MAG: HEAT repeat domain-containing protein [Planctomycetes bacterium]|nr:HEAT repeat domain-containing protein [Planctomycetota bacterium]
MSDGEKVAELKTELLQLCRDNNSEVRRAALNVLVRVLNNKDKDAIAPLQEAMQDKDIENRRNAAIAMSNIGGDKAVPALPVLLEAAKDRDADPQVRRQTVLAIRNIGKEAVGAMPELIRLLRDDDDEEVRKHAALAIGGIGAEAAKSGATFVQHIEPAVPILVEKIQNANERPEVRRECAMCLARIGRVPAADGIAPKLLAVLGDPDHDATVRERVMWALRVHEDNLTSFAGAKETFSKIMKEPRNQQNKMLRYDCAYMLGMIWKADAPDHALDLLLEFLHDKEIKIYRGTDTIAGSGGVEIVGAKGKVTDVGFGDGRTMATDALANIGPTRYGQRQDIMKQLQVIVDTTQYKVLKEKAENRIKAVR